MDVAYDHIQEESFVTSGENSGSGAQSNNSESSEQRQNFDLNAEFQETLRAFSSNPWGAKLGGLWGNVRRQGENYYQEARQEYNAASEEAIKGLNDLRESIVDKTRGLSIAGLGTGGEDENKEKDGDATATPTSPKAESASTAKAAGGDDADGEGFIARFRAEAAKRLKDIERAEDAADEALLKFGTNIRNFLRDAVSIAPPDAEQQSSNKVLFESKDIDGKRVIHTTRFEAQLHAIHSNLERLSHDPVSDEWSKWKSGFKVDDKTNEIAADLERYPELRRAMETLVPEKVEYADFWCRYYFLRLVIETEEKKRKELLKATADDDEEEVAWDEDSDSDDDAASTPQMKKDPSTGNLAPPATGSGSKPSEPRRSNDQQSQPDSDASYDLVSGTTSRSPGSPKEKEKSPPTAGATAPKADESDEEDWE